jgi:hypothetical protein
VCEALGLIPSTTKGKMTQKCTCERYSQLPDILNTNPLSPDASRKMMDGILCTAGSLEYAFYVL